MASTSRALLGSEGTCVTVLEATLKLVPSPRKRAVALIAFPDIYQAGDAAAFIRDHGPIGLEAMDDKLIGFMRDKHADMTSVSILPPGGGWLIAEFGGETQSEANQKARALEAAFKKRANPPRIKIAEDEHEQALIWKAREAGLGRTAFVPLHPVAWEGWEDAAVPPEWLGEYLRKFRKLLDRYGYDSTLCGCAHSRIDFGLRTSEGLGKMRRFLGDAASLVVEHGDGQSKAEILPKIRAGVDRSVPRVQGDLGPGLEDESRQGRRSFPDYLQHAARPGLRSAACPNPFQLSERRGKLRARRHPLRRRRQMPLGRSARQRHLSELHDDA
jgi:FAD/FMN-containing dehydrogenase